MPVATDIRPVIPVVDLAAAHAAGSATGATRFAHACARAAAWRDGVLPEPELGTAAWIDDVGLRRSASPTRAFLADAPATWLDPEPLDADAATLVVEHADHVALGGLLALLVDDLGRWDDAIAIARAIADHDFWHALDDRTLLRAGGLLAIDGDERCLDLFGHVALHADDPVDQMLGSFRGAVALVKRLDATPGRCRAALDASLRAVHHVHDRATRAILRALVHNLEALAEVRARNPHGARDLVRLAWSLVSGDETVSTELGPQFVAEARTQVLSNLAVVTGLLSTWDEAVPLFERGVAIAEAGPSDALRMETGCLLGLARYNAGDLDGALDALHHAETAGCKVALTMQHAQVHKLLALVEHDRGELDRSRAWLDRVHAAGGMP